MPLSVAISKALVSTKLHPEIAVMYYYKALLDDLYNQAGKVELKA